MAKETTSNEWHLRGVSLEVRALVDAYRKLNGLQQGDAVDYLLRKSPELQALAALLKSPQA
jgi:hypothetical protein